MKNPESVDQAREVAAADAKRLLRIELLTEEALFELGGAVLGAERTGRCLEISRLAPLTRRSAATSAIAGLIVGTRDVGVEWWSRVHEDLLPDRSWIERGTPDEMLAGDQDAFGTGDQGASCLALLGGWVADDAADARWGRPIDFVDLNDPRTDDRVVLPDGAKPGDRFVAAWDPGGRTYVHVVERTSRPDPIAEKRGLRRGAVGSRLGEYWYHEAAEADWAWAMATDTGPIRLPGEVAGEPSDPFATAVDPVLAERLRTWATEHGATAEQVGRTWQTKDDVWSARFRLGLPYSRPAPWWEFDRAVTAAVDDDETALAEAMARLDA